MTGVAFFARAAGAAVVALRAQGIGGEGGGGGPSPRGRRAAPSPKRQPKHPPPHLATTTRPRVTALGQLGEKSSVLLPPGVAQWAL